MKTYAVWYDDISDRWEIEADSPERAAEKYAADTGQEEDGTKERYYVADGDRVVIIEVEIEVEVHVRGHRTAGDEQSLAALLAEESDE